MEADVSAVADPATGVAVYETYGGTGWSVYGGTSASSPIIASVYALAGAPGRRPRRRSTRTPHTGSLNDVTSGNNGTCTRRTSAPPRPATTAPPAWARRTAPAAFTAGPQAETVTVANPGDQNSTTGSAASLQIKATGSADTSLTYSATGLPTGLSVNSTSGLISGSPTTAGTYKVTVTATSGTASGSATFTWTVTDATKATRTATAPNPEAHSSTTRSRAPIT